MLVRTIALATLCLLTLPLAAGDGDIVPQPRTGDPVAGLTADELDRFEDGKEAFAKVFKEEDGLGPVFNKDSCAGCHNAGGTGGAGVITVTRFGFLTKFGFESMEDEGGSLQQKEAISEECAEFVPDDANVEIKRLTNSTFGAGLVEAISDDDIEANEEIDDDDVSGRVHWVETLEDPDGPLRAGRFGWKAQVATVLTFSGDASLNEMGITNRLVTSENSPNGDVDLLAECDSVDDPEDDPDDDETDFIDLITDFQRFLAAPPQTPKSGMTGEEVFEDIGCAVCHVSTYTTEDVAEDALSSIEIRPYSDFLLHDMGGLGDLIEQGDAEILEMRTPSLWGLRVRNTLLHDGRADDLDFATRVNEAILEHDGEAENSVDAYEDLTKEEVADLMAFLDSLGRREFDHNGDNVVDDFDFGTFLACYLNSGDISADDECAISDIDQDGDVDDTDYELFLSVYTGDHPDCDDNGVSDLDDLINGEAEDCNENGVPDSCEIEPCESPFIRSDSNDDGMLSIADALKTLDFLFLDEGELGCDDSADANDDGRLDVADPIFALTALFLDGAEPSAPYPECGSEESADSIGCETFTSCE